jgi:hypothetical protein
MSEQIQKAFSRGFEKLFRAWYEKAYWATVHTERAKYISPPDSAHIAFHGGYTACQSRIRAKIAECEKSLELYDECTIGHRAITEAINALREVLEEI